MIKTWNCKDTQQLFEKGYSRRWQTIAKVALRRIYMLHAATDINSLRFPPGNRLEALHNDRTGQYSLRINDQWRICFAWKNNNAYNVEIVDYHN